MFGLTKREQRDKQELETAKLLLSFVTTIVEVAAMVRVAELANDALTIQQKDPQP